MYTYVLLIRDLLMIAKLTQIYSPPLSHARPVDLNRRDERPAARNKTLSLGTKKANLAAFRCPFLATELHSCAQTSFF